MSENKVITNDLIQLTISGISNHITIKSHISTLKITGTDNKINGLDPNCLIDNISISGVSNNLNLNQNCSNVNKRITGLENHVTISGVPTANANNMNNNMRNNNNVQQRFIRIENGNIQHNFQSNESLNSMLNDFNNFGININLNGQNQNRNNNQNNNNINVNNDDDDEENNENLSEFDKKKQNLFLEMDEYQYKHIQKYESRKETECAICLEEFKGIDIIKAFYKCEHIFHKQCLKSWLKRSNQCPLCKHDLTEDINQMH